MKYFTENKHTQVIQGRYGYYMLNNNSPIGRALQFYGEHAENEISVMKEFIPKGTTVFDIGAHQGTHTLAFANFVGSSGKVVAFEPQRTMHQIAAGTVALNELYNVRLYNLAVGSKQEIVKIPIFNYTQRGHFSGMSITNPEDGEEVLQIKIDDFAANLELNKNVSLVKIDVEGMEYQVLLGLKDLISKNNPVIYMELHSNNKYYSEIIDLVKKHKYKIYKHTTRGFNPDNYFGYKEDRFRGGVDNNAIAIPSAYKDIPPSVQQLDEIN